MNPERYSADYRFREISMPALPAVESNHYIFNHRVQDDYGQSQDIGVLLSNLPEAQTTIIRPMPITDEISRPQLADDQGVYRAISGSRVIGVDFPGMGTATGPLTRAQKAELKNLGSFKEVADMQWRAIENVLEQSDGSLRKLGRVVLWGTSLGSAQVAALYAAKPEEVEVTDIVLQITPWETKFGRLAIGLAKAAEDRGYYYELDGENYRGRESDKDWLLRIARLRKLGAAARAGWALTKGNIISDLTSRPLKDTRVHIMNAEHDSISPTDYNLAAAADLKESGAHVTHEFMPGEYHAIQLSRRVIGVQARDVVDSY